MSLSVFINGSYFTKNDAKISALDIGLTRSFGIYEGVTSVGPSIFKFKEHMDRLRRSADGLGIFLSYSDKEIEKILQDLIKNINSKRTEIRIYATGGETINGIEFDPKKSSFIVFVDAYNPFDKIIYEKGTKLITYEHLRFMPECKTTNYITGVLVQKLRKEQGAMEVLYTYQGKALECAISNIFMIKNGVLITPKDNILKGITRKVVIDLAKKFAIAVEEREVEIEELLNADEVFITSSYKDVMPIVYINKKVIKDGKVGSITKNLIFDFWKELGYDA